MVVREILDKAGAASCCKTSGKRGLHVYVPLGQKYTFPQVKLAADILARLIHRQLPATTTLDSRTEKRLRVHLASEVVADGWRLPPVPARVPIRGPKLSEATTIRPVPAAIREIAAGGGGRFLCLALPSLKQVAVFDATEGRIVKYLDVGTQKFQIAAGMTKLLIAQTDSKVLQRWDLTTFAREASRPM